MSTPGLVQKRLSSIDTIASCIDGEMSLKSSITTLLGGASNPIGRQWSSYRNELASSCLYCCSFSICGISEATAIIIPNTVETIASAPKPIRIDITRSFRSFGLPERPRRLRRRGCLNGIGAAGSRPCPGC